MPDVPAHEERHIQEYVEGQWKHDDDPVTLVQKVGSRRVLGQTYEQYDVHCEETRWWVITDPMNLYAQEDFPDIDMALTFHIGLRARMFERSRKEIDEEEEAHVSRAWRRYEQAVEAMDSASEAEDYQAVGIKCREALIAVVQEHADADWVGTLADAPARSDVKGWGAVFAMNLSDGRMRAYMKRLFEGTWDLAVWLQHEKNAVSSDAEFVLEATAHLLGCLAALLHGRTQRTPERCPRCDSYRVTDAFDAVEEPEPGFVETPVCGACEWRGEPRFTSWAKHFEGVDPKRIEEYLGSSTDLSDRFIPE